LATNTYVALDKTTLISSAASITFSGINQGYADLILVAEYAGFSSAGATTLCQLNTDTVTTHYSSTVIGGDGSSAYSDRYLNNSGQVGMLMGGGGVGYGSGRAVETFHLNNYSNSNTYKTVLSRFSQAGSAVTESVGLWNQTSAITSVTITNYGGRTISAGST
jgi:hypothetical protein